MQRTWKPHRRALAAIALAAMVAWPLQAKEPVSFEREIAPLLEQRCVRCHGSEQQKGSLSLATRAAAMQGGESGAVLVAGKPEESLLLEMVGGSSPAMPKQGRALTNSEIDLLRRWIAEGANWPDDRALAARAPDNRDWWSLQSVKRPELPPVNDAKWPRNAIDHFILAKLEANGLTPSPEADRRTLLRRLSFDLWGLPPSPEQVAAIVMDNDSQAFEKRVDEHLQSIHFGERYARHWLDVVRFADTHGFEMNQERANAWPYRDYVIRAFANDLPYDRFLQEQLAGDALGVDEATGFLVAGAWDQVKSPDPVLTANQRADELHDIVSTTGSALLGLTVGCARCHDHKFDPIPQTDYYAIKAMFEGVQHGERALKTGPSEQREAKLAELRRGREELAAELYKHEPIAQLEPSLVLHPQDARVQQLVPTKGTEPYTEGELRGQRGFRGGALQLPTLGKGYFYWNNIAGKDVAAWSPKLAGKTRIWVSWGCGWKTHATDAAYFLDRDGDLATKDDQVEIARIDQQRFADGMDEPPGQPLWSGLRDLGVHDLTPGAKLVLRGGATEAYVAADLVVFESPRRAGFQPASEIATAGRMPALRVPVVPGTNVERFEPVEARYLRFTIAGTLGAEPCIDELQVFTAEASPRNIALASTGTKATASGTYPNSTIHRLEHINDGRFGNEASTIHRLEHINDGRFGNEASWISNEAGRGWVQLEFPENVKIDRLTWGRDQSPTPKYEDRLPLDYRIEVSTDGNAWQLVAASHDRLPQGTPVPGNVLVDAGVDGLADLLQKRDSLDRQIAGLSASPMAYCGRMSAPGATHRLHRGDPTQPREPIAAGALTALPVKIELPDQASEPQRRLALARWMTDKQNPLAARVIVNRLWQWHFGEGLVDTPSDFGVNGARPTHPELLDYLAAELMDHGWSLRHVHRLIITSAYLPPAEHRSRRRAGQRCRHAAAVAFSAAAHGSRSAARFRAGRERIARSHARRNWFQPVRTERQLRAGVHAQDDLWPRRLSPHDLHDQDSHARRSQRGRVRLPRRRPNGPQAHPQHHATASPHAAEQSLLPRPVAAIRRSPGTRSGERYRQASATRI